MAQKIREDKIGTLSHAGGIITMTASTSVPAWLTIGGQQYKATSSLSRTITADVTLAANTLYMVFAVRNAGNTELRISANANSVGPAGFTSWKLVGAFYSTAAVTPIWGSFVNIDGPPETQNEITEPGATQLNAFFAGFSAFTVSNYEWTRAGKHLFVTWRLDSVTGNGVSGRVPLPRGIVSTAVGSGNVGTYVGQNGAGNAGGGSMIGLGSSDVGFAGPNLNNAALSLQVGTAIVGTAPTSLAGSFRVSIVQWSATPLKDL